MQAHTHEELDKTYPSDTADTAVLISRKTRWLRFLLVIGGLAVAIHFAPAVERLPLVGKQVTVLRESGVNVGAWYYDNVEEYFEAEEYIKYQKIKQDRIKDDPAP
ncbi:MAG: hypothetical protein ACQESV_08310 [Thermodesulfobacteriota bacterium]